MKNINKRKKGKETKTEKAAKEKVMKKRQDSRQLSACTEKYIIIIRPGTGTRLTIEIEIPVGKRWSISLECKAPEAVSSSKEILHFTS